MKIYLIGDKNTKQGKENLYKYEEYLSQNGHVVINPLKVIEALPIGINHSDYVVISTGLIRICDAVCYVPGHEKSLIAGLEKGNAIRQEKAVYATNDNI